MHDTDSLPLDHLEAVTDEEGVADLAALSDGLRAEREQGITIDVAYRFFSTETPQLHPGRHPRPRALHPQHVHRRLQRPRRDPARRRPRRRAAPDPQARPDRETAWASSTSWPTVNKIDLVDFDQSRFDEVEAELQQMAAPPRRRRAVRHPDRRQARRQRRAPLGQHPLVRRARRCWSTSRASNCPRRSPRPPSCGCRSSGCPGPPPTSAAATPAGWRRAR